VQPLGLRDIDEDVYSIALNDDAGYYIKHPDMKVAVLIREATTGKGVSLPGYPRPYWRSLDEGKAAHVEPAHGDPVRSTGNRFMPRAGQRACLATPAPRDGAARCLATASPNGGSSRSSCVPRSPRAAVHAARRNSMPSNRQMLAVAHRDAARPS
jgi:hypothetical protein